MATAIIDTPTRSRTGKQNPSAMTVREKRTLYRALVILETYLKRPSGESFSNADAVRAYLTIKLAREESEQFIVMFLDVKNRLIEAETMFYGTLTETRVYPREVVKRALHHNAAAVIFAHNHPSGVAEPSQSDLILTITLKQALSLVDVYTLDHFIIAGRNTLSFAERGMLNGEPEHPQKNATEKEKRASHARKQRQQVRARPPAVRLCPHILKREVMSNKRKKVIPVITNNSLYLKLAAVLFAPLFLKIHERNQPQRLKSTPSF